MNDIDSNNNLLLVPFIHEMQLKDLQIDSNRTSNEQQLECWGVNNNKMWNHSKNILKCLNRILRSRIKDLRRPILRRLSQELTEDECGIFLGRLFHNFGQSWTIQTLYTRKYRGPRQRFNAENIRTHSVGRRDAHLLSFDNDTTRHHDLTFKCLRCTNPEGEFTYIIFACLNQSWSEAYTPNSTAQLNERLVNHGDKNKIKKRCPWKWHTYGEKPPHICKYGEGSSWIFNFLAM